MTRTVRSIPLPSIEEGGSWGSDLIAHPEKPVVIVSLPATSHSVPWAVVNIDTGDVFRAKGLPGDLRDGIFDGDQALLLATHGLCRVTLWPKPHVDEVIRPKGLGKHLHRLIRVSDGLLAATRSVNHSTVILSADDLSPVKRLQIVAPHTVRRVSDSSVEFLSFHSGEAVEVSLRSLKISSRRPIPEGTQPIEVTDGVYLLSGKRARLTLHPAPKKEEYWRIKPERLMVLDDTTLEPLRSAKVKRGARDVLAVTSDRVIVSAEYGFRVFNRADLRLLEDVEVSNRGVGSHVYVAAAKAVCINPTPFHLTELKSVHVD